MRKSMMMIAVLAILPAGLHRAAVAETKAPDGCYLKLERDGNYMCCHQRGAMVCHKIPSTINGGTGSDRGSKHKSIATPGGGTVQQ
jgi:hypothetical protein